MSYGTAPHVTREQAEVSHDEPLPVGWGRRAVALFICASFVGTVSFLSTQQKMAAGLPRIEQETDALTSSKPHIILFTIDDMGWNDFGTHSTDLPNATEFMNELVKKSIWLNNYYTQPSCTPSRATIMSGKWVHKTGYQNMEIQYSYPVGMPLSHKLMPKHLQEIGYRTYGFGKWNIGHCNEKYLPHMRGFNYFLGYSCPGHGYRDYICGMHAGVKDMIEGRSEQTPEGTLGNWTPGSSYQGTYDTEVYRDVAAETIHHHALNHVSEPLFMWVAHHGVHGTEDSEPNPPASLLTDSNRAYLEKLDDELAEASGGGEVEFFSKRKITATLLMSVDNALKHLVTTLEEEGLMSNTIIFVNSDNGGDPNYQVGHPGNNWPLRSEKFFYFEGAIRVPAFVYAPGLIPKNMEGTQFKGLMHHVDLLTTFTGINGVDAHNSDSELDGYNMMPAILGKEDSPRHELILTLPREGSTWKLGQNTTTEALAVRLGDYKLVLNSPTDNWFKPKPQDPDVAWFLNQDCSYDWYSVTTTGSTDCAWTHFLFDIRSDPTERTNLWDSEEHMAIKAKIIERAYKLLAEDTNEYGKKMYETYEQQSASGVNTDKREQAFHRNDMWVVPWDCPTIQ